MRDIKPVYDERLSEELNDIISRMPNKTSRWGMLIIILIVGLLIFIASKTHYPELKRINSIITFKNDNSEEPKMIFYVDIKNGLLIGQKVSIKTETNSNKYDDLQGKIYRIFSKNQEGKIPIEVMIDDRQKFTSFIQKNALDNFNAEVEVTVSNKSILERIINEISFKVKNPS